MPNDRFNRSISRSEIERKKKEKEARRKQRLQEGMVDEIKGLLDRGIPAENLIYYGLEYKFIKILRGYAYIYTMYFPEGTHQKQRF